MFDPFHEGEIRIQERTGERLQAVMNGRLIGETIPDKASGFVRLQTHAVLSGLGQGGDPWALVLAGDPGFARPMSGGARLAIRLEDPAGVLTSASPLGSIVPGAALGVLFLEYSTRRRLRVNGSVESVGPEALVVEVHEAFPNCTKYIQRRASVLSQAPPSPVHVESGTRLGEDLRAWIAAADTLFVASAHPAGRVDASHRGGKPGFVRLEGDSLRVPDYPGNSMFGTLGNFAVHPRAGLVFPDFERDRQLRLVGDVELDFDSASDLAETGGTGRWWTFHLREWSVSPLNRGTAWGEPELSPSNP